MSSVLTIDMERFPQYFDPGANMTNSGWYILNSTSITLFDLAEDQSLKGLLAKSWEALDGGSRYRVKIHSDAQFHDGTPITAKDIVFSLRRKQHLWPNYQLFDWIDFRSAEATKIIDDHTIEFNLKSAYQFFLFILALPGTGIVPSHLYPAEEVFNSERLPVLGGPYRFTEWKKGEYVKLEWFEHWFNPRGNRAKTIYVFEKNDPDAVRRFLSGETDVLMDVRNHLSREPSDTLERLTSFFPRYNTVSLAYLNAIEGPLKDRKVRKAFAAALRHHRKEWNNSPGIEIPADQFYPPGYSGQTEVPRLEVSDFADTYKELKANPVKIRYPYPKSWAAERVESLVADLAEFGFEIEIIPLSVEEILRRRNEGTGFDLGFWFIPMPPGDPTLVYRIDFGKDDFYVADPNDGRLYEMIEQTKKTGLSSERIQMAKDITRYIEEESFIVPLTFRSMPFYGQQNIDFSRMPRWQFNVRFSDIEIKKTAD